MPRLNPKNMRRKVKKHETLVQSTAAAVLSIRKWKFANRLKFTMWLLFGRGEWKGVR